MSTFQRPSRPPFMYLSRDQVRKVTLNGREVDVRVMIHAAYNAGGIIGGEYNGVGIAQEPTFTKHTPPRVKTKGQVLVCGAFRSDSMDSVPTEKQLEVFNHLLTCHSAEFIDFVRKYGIHTS